MAKEVRSWLCGVCKAGFDSKDKAEECEKAHTSASEIVKEGYIQRCPWPGRIKVLMKDGSTHTYELRPF